MADASPRPGNPQQTPAAPPLGYDVLYYAAVDAARQANGASVRLMEQKLRLNRGIAEQVVSDLERLGVVGAAQQNGRRPVLLKPGMPIPSYAPPPTPQPTPVVQTPAPVVQTPQPLPEPPSVSQAPVAEPTPPPPAAPAPQPAQQLSPEETAFRGLAAGIIEGRVEPNANGIHAHFGDINFARAFELRDQLEERGVIGPIDRIRGGHPILMKSVNELDGVSAVDSASSVSNDPPAQATTNDTPARGFQLPDPPAAPALAQQSALGDAGLSDSVPADFGPRQSAERLAQRVNTFREGINSSIEARARELDEQADALKQQGRDERKQFLGQQWNKAKIFAGGAFNKSKKLLFWGAFIINPFLAAYAYGAYKMYQGGKEAIDTYLRLTQKDQEAGVVRDRAREVRAGQDLPGEGLTARDAAGLQQGQALGDGAQTPTPGPVQEQQQATGPEQQGPEQTPAGPSAQAQGPQNEQPDRGANFRPLVEGLSQRFRKDNTPDAELAAQAANAVSLVGLTVGAERADSLLPEIEKVITPSADGKLSENGRVAAFSVIHVASRLRQHEHDSGVKLDNPAAVALSVTHEAMRRATGNAVDASAIEPVLDGAESKTAYLRAGSVVDKAFDDDFGSEASRGSVEPRVYSADNGSRGAEQVVYSSIDGNVPGAEARNTDVYVQPVSTPDLAESTSRRSSGPDLA